MKKKNKANNQKNKHTANHKMTRKEALKKGSQYAAFTAASMLMVLSPKESQANSPTTTDSPRSPDKWR